MEAEIMNPREELIGSNKETLYMLGGVAVVVFGAGMVLSNPTVRRCVGQMNLDDFAAAALRGLERYFRMRRI